MVVSTVWQKTEHCDEGKITLQRRQTERRIQADPSTHWRTRLSILSGLMARGPEKRLLRAVRSEANGVIHDVRRDLVVVDETGQDRQTSGVGGGEAGRA